MKIVIPGGTGQVGTATARHFHSLGHEVVVLSRSPRVAPWRTVVWDARSVAGWVTELDGADLVLNLAGRSVDCRYGLRNREEILRSRVDSVHAVAGAINRARRPPPLWLQMGTATIYTHRFDAPNDERHGLVGVGESCAPDAWRFSHRVAESWEASVSESPTPGTRRVILRTAMVMTPDPGGVFDRLLQLVRCGLGGPVAGGRQFVSWIHEADFLTALEFLKAHPEIEGPVNLAAPNPLPHRDFMRMLRKAWGRSFGLPATRWMLEIGAFMLRTESELVLKSRRVVPGRLVEAGFPFRLPEWSGAATDLCQRVRERLKTAA
jgi:uncharacterized protein (TIGR01777 family)